VKRCTYVAENKDINGFVFFIGGLTNQKPDSKRITPATEGITYDHRPIGTARQRTSSMSDTFRMHYNNILRTMVVRFKTIGVMKR
jgi:hypothetical protein